MKNVFKRLWAGLAVCLLTMGTVAAATYTEGVHYTKAKTELPTRAPEGKVEVAEIFWYGCPHCFHLEQTMANYQTQKPENVAFIRVPATFDQWVVQARLYYIGQILDADGSKHIHSKIFNAIHQQRRRINNDDSMRRFFKGAGFGDAEISAAMKDPSVTTMLNYAQQITSLSGIDSVPAIIVNGKYLTSPSMVSGNDELIKVVNYLTTLESR
ncbi:MAG TPA: thiol:disulfide interchange protein DsbA/DsbL [Thiolinea sp.]|nr:thiol:disulfide interchange protein DsbA/DsbL [Thiolinea sp.]